MNIALVLICLTHLYQKPATNRELPVRKASTMRLIKTDHFQIFHHKRYLTEAQELALEGERFIDDLEKTWAVVLPDKRVTVSLLLGDEPVTHHDHLPDDDLLDVVYRKRSRRIEFHLTRRGEEAITQEQLNQNLRHYLVHVYLDQWEPDRLPFFFAEGLAHQYDQNPMQTYTYNLILGFNHIKKNPNPDTLSERAFFENNGGPYYSALANLFVQKLWQENADAEITFMQRHLVGQPLDLTLMNAGLADYPELMAQFIRNNGDLYPMARLVKTLDFWAILGGIVFLIAAVVHVATSLREAMMEHVEISMEADLEGFPGQEAQAVRPARMPTAAPTPMPDSLASAPSHTAAPTTPPPVVPIRQDDEFEQQTTDAIVFLDDTGEAPAPLPPSRPTRAQEAPLEIDLPTGDPKPIVPPRRPAAHTPPAVPTPPRRPAAHTPPAVPTPPQRTRSQPITPPSPRQPQPAATAAGISPPSPREPRRDRGTPIPPTPPPRPATASPPPTSQGEFSWDLDDLEDDLDSAFDILGGKDT